jgi:hypothetical protein
VLTQGLHEVTSLLVTEFTLDDVLRVILETIYRALGVSRTRAFFMLKDATLPKARFRFGMGQSAADMRTWMEVPLKGTQDLFVLAMNQARDLVIKDLPIAGAGAARFRTGTGPRRSNAATRCCCRSSSTRRAWGCSTSTATKPARAC